MLKIPVEIIMRNYMEMTSLMMKNANNKKHTLKVIPNDI